MVAIVFLLTCTGILFLLPVLVIISPRGADSNPTVYTLLLALLMVNTFMIFPMARCLVLTMKVYILFTIFTHSFQ